jgi:hypothetical protein
MRLAQINYRLRACSAVAVFFLAIVAAPGGESIRQVDFKNFVFPWGNPGSPLETWHWLHHAAAEKVRLSRGKHEFLTEAAPDPDSALLRFVSIAYGDLAGDDSDEAAVHLNYTTGGTANWSYLYIFELKNGAPHLMAWLESGSRADGGLVRVKIGDRQLVLDFSDGKKRIADCCSTGYIRVHYVWKDGRFVEIEREHGKLQINSSR